jgi:hypothetical protein
MKTGGCFIEGVYFVANRPREQGVVVRIAWVAQNFVDLLSDDQLPYLVVIKDRPLCA